VRTIWFSSFPPSTAFSIRGYASCNANSLPRVVH
jgi:hypothetical protein